MIADLDTLVISPYAELTDVFVGFRPGGGLLRPS